MGDDDTGLDLGHYGRVLAQSAGAIATLVAVVAACATVVALRTPRVYRAEAMLHVEPRDPRVVDFQGVHTEAVEDETRYLRTQYQVLKSRALAEQVIRDTGLRHEPLLGGRPVGPDTDWGRLDPALVDRYLAGVDVEAVPGTRLIKVSFTAGDADFAARVANAHVEAFVRQGLRQRTAMNQAGLDFLRARMSELKDRLQSSEAALNDFRWRRGILVTGDDRQNLVVEQLDEVNKQLAKAEADRLAAEAQVRTIDTQGVEALPEVTKNTTLYELRVHLALADSEYARMASQFKPAYAGVAELKQKADTLRERLAAETARVAESVRNDYRAARDTEDRLRARLEERKAEALAQKDAAVDYAILAREVDANRALYDSVLQKMKEMAVAVEVRATNVTVADRAVPPTAPAGPARARSVATTALLALVAGVVLAFLRDALDHTVKTADDVERHGGVANLGVVPAAALRRAAAPLFVAGRRTRGAPVVLAREPRAAVADAYRQIRTALLLSRPGGPPRTLLVASGGDGEGKTLTTANLAVAFAQLPGRVCVIDGDLRRPTLHRLLGVDDAPGLTEVLTGQCTLDQALHTLPGHALAVVPAGAMPPNPTELLGSAEMKALLAAVAARFDWVLVDSPAAFAAAETTVLATMVEGVVLVARAQRTPRRALRTLRARLASVGAPLVGAVLNDAADGVAPYGSAGVTIALATAPRTQAGRSAA
jgi:polysaccharide biosynthesis transport protein